MTCLACQTDPPVARGLCHKCWNSASRLVKRGVVTWTALEATGRAKPPLDPHRSKPGPRKALLGVA